MDFCRHLLGMELESAKKFLISEDRELKIDVVFIQGDKDKEILKVPRVIRISQKCDNVIEIIASVFSNPI